MAGNPVSASSDCVRVAELGELWSEFVVDVRSVSATREQHGCAACSAPLEHLEMDILFDRNELHLVRGWVAPRRRLLSRHNHPVCFSQSSNTNHDEYRKAFRDRHIHVGELSI